MEIQKLILINIYFYIYDMENIPYQSSEIYTLHACIVCFFLWPQQQQYKKKRSLIVSLISQTSDNKKAAQEPIPPNFRSPQFVRSVSHLPSHGMVPVQSNRRRCIQDRSCRHSSRIVGPWGRLLSWLKSAPRQP